MPVIAWYRELLDSSDFIIELLDNADEGWNASIHLLDLIKVGLYSSNAEIIDYTCKLLIKFGNEMGKKESWDNLWKWFVFTPAGALQGLLRCINKKITSSIDLIIEMLQIYGKSNFEGLFTQQIKALCTNMTEYYNVITFIIQPLKDSICISPEILHSWIELACQNVNLENINPDERASALTLLIEIWIFFPKIIEENTTYANDIIKLSQRANRDKNESLQLASLALLFKLMETFASEKNEYASIVYKTLTFTLVEKHQESKIREFILQNLKLLFEKFQSIPSFIVLEPYIKQIRISEGVTFFYDIFDFEFFETIARHPQLTTANGLQLLDILAKTYLMNGIYAGCALNSFILIAYRFRDIPSVSTYMLKFIKVNCIFTF